MKKILSFTVLIISTLSVFSQNSVLISPTGTEAIKFKSVVGEKITFFDNGIASKHGIGLTTNFSQSVMNFYTPTTADDFVFGVGVNSTITERFRIKGNGNVGIGVSNPDYPLVTKGRIRIRDSGAGESAGIWLNNNGNTALNTFIGIDLSNNFGIYSPILTSNIFTAKMSNGYIGIGTSTPEAQLHVESTSDNPMIISGQSGLYVSYREGTQWRGYFGSYYGNAEDVDFGVHSSNPTGKVHFTTNGIIRMSIQETASGGNVVIAGKIVNEAQQTPTFQNSWVNYASGYAGAKYYKDKENRVQLSGGVANPNPVSGSVIFTLPVGYRPAEHLTYHVDALAGSSARVTIFSNGEVTFYSSNTNSQYLYVSLSGISFRLD